MAWVPPRTWTAAVVTVPQLNEQIRDNLTHLKTTIDADGIPLLSGVVAVATTYSISLGTDQLVLASGTFVVTLPTAVGRQGRCVTVKNYGVGVITMNTAVGEYIDSVLGSAGSTKLYTSDSLTFASAYDSWWII
jgi:hypothetical protein